MEQDNLAGERSRGAEHDQAMNARAVYISKFSSIQARFEAIATIPLACPYATISLACVQIIFFFNEQERDAL